MLMRDQSPPGRERLGQGHSHFISPRPGPLAAFQTEQTMEAVFKQLGVIASASWGVAKRIMPARLTSLAETSETYALAFVETGQVLASRYPVLKFFMSTLLALLAVPLAVYAIAIVLLFVCVVVAAVVVVAIFSLLGAAFLGPAFMLSTCGAIGISMLYAVAFNFRQIEGKNQPKSKPERRSAAAVTE
ncbi:uncharacterized protein BJ171DRAFT_566034 [Polychytrium aggregatum]|uniref:uncharacterized protein n=1 Tax=Polychytrium aggregatum TaxID=110093 RepID=UPI0022FE4290|nr:uncharacterized protein BJ171DRAFT_566034 [Polychytrium aggregatum]KAI9207199.1 hypothetical protein BJ171DRAFT_566034 [Polychytrium aggregatum]